MADRYDPLPDLAALTGASIHMDGIPAAYRIARKLRITPGTGFGEIGERLREALAPALTDSERFQVQEARDILGTWDLNNPGGVSRETVLADQIRALLAIIDEKGPPRVTIDEARDHIRDEVIHASGYNPAKTGVIEGVSRTSVFVRFAGAAHAEGTDPADLTLLEQADAATAAGTETTGGR